MVLHLPNKHCMCCAGRLAEKIRAARVNKERAMQLQEKAQLAAQEAEYDHVYDKVLLLLAVLVSWAALSAERHQPLAGCCSCVGPTAFSTSRRVGCFGY